jgi:hypothetical protein
MKFINEVSTELNMTVSILIGLIECGVFVETWEQMNIQKIFFKIYF